MMPWCIYRQMNEQKMGCSLGYLTPEHSVKRYRKSSVGPPGSASQAQHAHLLISRLDLDYPISFVLEFMV
jgi:hypothetical protein